MRVVTWYDQRYLGLAHITVPSMKRWAARNSASFHEINAQPELMPPAWSKLLHIVRAIEQFNDDILWLDVDCYVPDENFAIRLAIPGNPDISFGEDANGLCSAVMLCRPTSMDILRAALTLGNIPTLQHQEQSTIRRMIEIWPQVAARTHVGIPIMDRFTPREKPFVVHGMANNNIENAVAFIREHKMSDPLSWAIHPVNFANTGNQRSNA